MDDDKLVSACAALMGKSETDVQDQIMTLAMVGLMDIYSFVPSYWTKSSAELTLPASGNSSYIVDLKQNFLDIKTLKLLWTTEGSLTPISEKKFRNDHPDPSNDLGCPKLYFFREPYIVEIWPHNDTSRTLYASYHFMPDFKSITGLPDEWRHVPVLFCFGVIEGPEKNYYKNMYQKALKQMESGAKEAEETYGWIIGDGTEDSIYGEMEKNR